MSSISRTGPRAPTRPRSRLPSATARLVTVPTLVIASTAFLPPTAGAQQQAAGDLQSVVVIGTREPQALRLSTADVTLIPFETLRDTAADSVEDLLRREASLQLARNGGPGQSSGFFFRGANTNSTVVLIDGVRVGSATLGQAEFEALTLAQIDHIEVLRGPASSLYGADAVGGVVQIFTRRGSGPPRVTAGVAVGGHGSAQGDLGVSGSQGAFDYAASVGRERSRGVSALRPGDRYGYYNPDDDGYARNFGNLRLGFTPAAGHRIGVSLVETTLDSQYDSADYDANFKPNAALDFRTRLRTQAASLDYRGEISALWTTSAQLSNAVDDSHSGATNPSAYKTSRDQLTWQNALHLATGQQLVLAYEHVREVAQASGFPNDPQRDNNALVAGYTGRFADVHELEASVRRDQNSAYGGNTTGNLGYAFSVTPEWKLRALAGTMFRAPTFNDLYYPHYGVATIRPERGRSVEVGAAWQRGTASASATLYRNRLSDLIGYDSNAQDCPVGDNFGCANNIARARLQGATLAAAERFGGLAVRGSVDFLDAKDAATGVRLPRRAAHQETLAVDDTLGPWTFGGSVVDIGSRPDGGVTLGSYALVDLRAAWRFLPQWRVEAKLQNALGHRDEPTRDYQGLGRQAWIGVRYDGNGF